MKKLMKIIQIHTEKNLESTVWVFEPVLGQDQEHDRLLSAFSINN